MGCGPSQPNTFNGVPYSDKSVIAMTSALLIQRWYRRYVARLEAKRQTTWTIFQSLEYAGEQDQLKLYNFFHDMITQLQLAASEQEGGVAGDERGSVIRALALFKTNRSMEEDDADLWAKANPEKVQVPTNYRGPQLTFPLTTTQTHSLTDAFKNKQTLHPRYVLEVLHATRRQLKSLSTVQTVTLADLPGHQVTVVGDLHGQLDDLLTIFFKNGLPDRNNAYIFNGDFVDRGTHSVEVSMLLFCYFLLFPGSVFINRGNHEDRVMNLRYGFIKEISHKYKGYVPQLVALFEDVFSWLPLATVVDGKVFVAHGGISSYTNLQTLNYIDRHDYLSIIQPPRRPGEELNPHQWSQLVNIVWSDPRAKPGCEPNDFRGGGCYWGPDVSETFLKKHDLQLIIRSHQCTQEGYEFMHNNKVLTVFSASNYYEEGSNMGAYIVLGMDLVPRPIQFIVTKQTQKQMSSSKTLNTVEASAMRGLQHKIFAHHSALLESFQQIDMKETGCITVGEWCNTMREVTGLDLPWRSLCAKLVRSGGGSGNVLYNTTFNTFRVKNKMKDDSAVDLTEALYRNKDSLETIFRAIDKDNSGSISVEEFTEACELLSQHTHTPLSSKEIRHMARNIDMNNDGFIDFNEFLEAFRIVDNFGRELQRRQSEQEVAQSL